MLTEEYTDVADDCCLISRLVAQNDCLRKALQLGLKEIESRAFIAGCVDDVPSTELMRLRRLVTELKGALNR